MYYLNSFSMGKFVIVEDKSILINESTVLDLYKKLIKNENPSAEENERILQRFRELVNHNNTNGTKMP